MRKALILFVFVPLAAIGGVEVMAVVWERFGWGPWNQS